MAERDSLPIEEGLPDDLELIGDEEEIPANGPVEVPDDDA
jgi:hypothetical protein